MWHSVARRIEGLARSADALADALQEVAGISTATLLTFFQREQTNAAKAREAAAAVAKAAEEEEQQAASEKALDKQTEV